MKRLVSFLWGLVLASCTLTPVPAAADYMGGIWAPGTSPPAGATSFVRIAPSSTGEPPTLATNIYALTVIPENPRYWEWNATFAVKSSAAYGEHTGFYVKAHRYGAGPLFGGVIELNDFAGAGPVWALEVDAMTSGLNPGPKTGIGIVVGRARDRVGRDPADVAPSKIDYALRVLPNYYDIGKVSVDYGLKIDTPCNEACISIPGGSLLALDGEGSVGATFDPRTGFLHFGIKGKEPALSVQMDTGEIRSRGRLIAPSAGSQWH